MLQHIIFQTGAVEKKVLNILWLDYEMVGANALWYDLPICLRVFFSRCAFFNSNSRFGRLLSQHIHTCVTLHILLIAMIWKMKQGYMVSLCHSMPEGNLSNPIAFELNYVLCHNFPSLFTSFKKHKMKITKKKLFLLKHKNIEIIPIKMSTWKQKLANNLENSLKLRPLYTLAMKVFAI